MDTIHLPIRIKWQVSLRLHEPTIGKKEERNKRESETMKNKYEHEFNLISLLVALTFINILRPRHSQLHYLITSFSVVGYIGSTLTKGF